MKQRGFTLIELVIVIAILGILAGVAIPHYLSFEEETRGARILADLRAVESSANMYSVVNGALPTSAEAKTALVSKYLAAWPIPPTGNFRVTGYDNVVYRYRMMGTSTYDWNGAEASANQNRATIGGWTTDDLLKGSTVVSINGSIQRMK